MAEAFSAVMKGMNQRKPKKILVSSRYAINDNADLWKIVVDNTVALAYSVHDSKQHNQVKTMKTKWQYSGDINMLDYGGKNIRQSGKRQFQIVELINMDEACGRDNKGQPKYVVELRLVDLAALSETVIKSALHCCGQDREGLSDDCLAECCDSYGAHAPLESFSGNNAHKLLRQAYKAANALLDSEELETCLDRTVNKIGSSAREFMVGDLMSAIQRGCESGNTDARIMAKMHGCPQEAIDGVRPDDWLPYLMGYSAALHGGAKETDPDTSPEYFRGYDRGLNVKAGNCPAPTWIQHQPAQA